LGAKPDGVGAVGIGLYGGAEAVDASQLLIGFQNRAMLTGIDHKRPKRFGRNRSGQRYRIGLAAIEIIAGRIVGRKGIDRAGARLGGGHGRGDAGGTIEKQNAIVEHQLPVVHELEAAPGKGGIPVAVGVEIDAGFAGREGNGPSRRVAHRDGVGEDLLHAIVWSEGLSLFDADRSQQTHKFGVKGIRRFVLNDGIKLFVDLEGVAVNSVELHAGGIDEFLGGWVGGLGQGVGVEPGFHARYGCGDVAPLHKGAGNQQVAVGGRFRHEIAVREGFLVGTMHKQILAPLPFVWSGKANIGHPEEVGVVHRSQHTGGHFYHHRPPFEVDFGEAVDRGGVWGEEQGAGIHQFFGDAQIAGLQPHGLKALQHGVEGGGWHAVEEGFHAAQEVEVVVDLLDGGAVGHAVKEAEGAELGGLNYIRGQDGVGYGGGIGGLGARGVGHGFFMGCGGGAWRSHRLFNLNLGSTCQIRKLAHFPSQGGARGGSTLASSH
jgi:hypothetical protein